MSNRKKNIVHWALPLVAAIAGGGLFLYWQWPSQQKAPDTQIGANEPAPVDRLSGADIAELYSQESTFADSLDTEEATKTTEPQSSAAFVELHASREGSDIRIELDIDQHWHINANPASFDFLIPTKIEIAAEDARLPISLDYPAGHPIEVGLDEPIRVYSGRTSLIAHLSEPKHAEPLQVDAQVQACNDSGLCLPPSMLSTTITQ